MTSIRRNALFCLPAAAALLLSGCSDPQCGDDHTAIHDIQGSSAQSPMLGQQATIEGVVTAALTGDEEIGSGLFVQAEPSDWDDQTDTSEAIYVLTDERFPPGTAIRASGSVLELGETNTMTALQADEIARCGEKPMPQPVRLELPFSGQVKESLEGMLVHMEQTLEVIDVYALGTRAQMTVASGGPVWQPTEIAEPGDPARKVNDANRQRMLTIDDFSLQPNAGIPAFIDPDLSPKTLLKAGDQITQLNGILSHLGGFYRLHLSQPTTVVSRRPRQRFSPPAGNITIGGFNLLNFFNGDGLGGGFPTSRGAASHEEFERQTQKLIAALSGLGHPDIVALMELENDGSERRSAISELVDKLNRQINVGRRTYEYVSLPGGNLGGDQIAVGMIYRMDKIRPVGDAVTLLDPPFDYYNRPPLAQTFETIGDGEKLTVVAVHLKSKGCRDAEGLNLAQGDGQACWNPKRVEAVNRLHQWLQTDPTGSGDPDVLVIGDFNAYSREDPIRTMEEHGYVNLLEQFTDGPQYSFIYRGAAGSLDHAMASSSLLPQITGTRVWHVNANYSSWLDYRLNGKAGRIDELLFRRSAYRSSDHDPLVVGLNLGQAN